MPDTGARAIFGAGVKEAKGQALLGDLVRTPGTWKAGGLGLDPAVLGLLVTRAPPRLSFPFCRGRRLDTVAAKSFQLSGEFSLGYQGGFGGADTAGGGAGGGSAGPLRAWAPSRAEGATAVTPYGGGGECVGGSGLSCLFRSPSGQVQEHLPSPSAGECQNPSTLPFPPSRRPAARPPPQGASLWEASRPKCPCPLGGLPLTEL